VKRYLVIALIMKRNGGVCAFEWPTGCTGWAQAVVQHMLDTLQLHPVNFHGCAARLVAKGRGPDGKEKGLGPIFKPWTVYTDCLELTSALSGLQCNRSHSHIHAAGQHTVGTGSYPEKMCRIIHRALSLHFSRRAVKKVVAVPCVNLLGSDQQQVTESDLEQVWCDSSAVRDHDDQGRQAHRPKLDTTINCNMKAMVTRLLTRKDPEYHCAAAHAALDSEVSRLESAPVWAKLPTAKSSALKQFPEASFTRLFSILGIKASEGKQSEQKFKARVVCQGSWITDASGAQVFYADTSSAPTRMACIRSVVTFGQLTGSGSSSADAEQAYIQPLLPENEVIFVHIPADLQSPAMKRACVGIVEPVFRLLRPLYGLPRSGNIWEKYVAEKLKTINWARIPEWPQTYFKDGPKGRMILTIYVDDFGMAGWGHEDEWASVRKLIRTTEPAPVGRILGVHLSRLVPSEPGSQVVHTFADMRLCQVYGRPLQSGQRRACSAAGL